MNIELIRTSIKSNPRQPHYAFVDDLKKLMRITKKNNYIKR